MSDETIITRNFYRGGGAGDEEMARGSGTPVCVFRYCCRKTWNKWSRKLASKTPNALFANRIPCPPPFLPSVHGRSTWNAAIIIHWKLYNTLVCIWRSRFLSRRITDRLTDSAKKQFCRIRRGSIFSSSEKKLKRVWRVQNFWKNQLYFCTSR